MKRSFLLLAITLVMLTQSSGWAATLCFEEAGRAYTLPPHLLQSIAIVESGMNPSARNQNHNGSSDLGLMQINSSWIDIAHLDEQRLMNDACYNTLAGARILRGCIDQHGYTWEAVGCYNAVSSDKKKIYAWKVFRQLVANDNKLQSDLQSFATSTVTPRKNDQEQKNSYLSISIDNQEEESHWPSSPGPAENRAALAPKAVSP